MSVAFRVPSGCAWALLWSLAVITLLMPCMAKAAEPPRIVVEKAREMDILRQVPLSGTVTSARVSRLSPEISGQVAKLEVDFGDRVEAGQALLHLDDAISQWDYRASQALTRQLRAELADAERRYADAQRLRKQNSISENEILLRKAEVEIKAAALKRQEAEEQQQKVRYERHVVRAPFAGVISEKLTEIGEWVEPGTPVLELVAMNTLHADFAVPQQFYRLIDQNSQITLTLDALGRQRFEGRIETVVPVNDPSARTFMVRVLFKKQDEQITPGMSVNGVLQVSSRERGVAVSRDAVLRYPDGRITVWVVSEQDGNYTVAERRVSTGHGFDGMLEIREGIQAGETVVVEGNEALQDGQQVRIELRRQRGEH